MELKSSTYILPAFQSHRLKFISDNVAQNIYNGM